MCRLFGMLAPEPVSARFWLLSAPDSVRSQSYENPDGTRLAYYVGRRATVDRQPIAPPTGTESSPPRPAS